MDDLHQRTREGIMTARLNGKQIGQVPGRKLHAVKIEIDPEKLYYNMVEAKAEWLYTLPQWDSILSEEKRKELYKQQKASGTVRKAKKVFPNDPCPCGSGKKYKKCCGKNA